MLLLLSSDISYVASLSAKPGMKEVVGGCLPPVLAGEEENPMRHARKDRGRGGWYNHP
jgi:hypothetical protein